ncbi:MULTISPECIES: putative holin [Klebsiella]|uniref:putative holin n=1 Tax=Klebsiella TaxID=570 RepID=UPI003977D8FA
MSDPLTGTGLIFGGGLIGSVVFGVITHSDFGVVFGAFGGAVFYVATTANLTRGRQIAYFMTSFIVGVLAAGLLGSKFTTWTGYTDRPLDALGAVVASALIRVHLQPAIEAKPRFITFLGGRNDVIQKDSAGNFKFTIATVTSNIRYILTQFRKNGIIPVVCSMAAQNNSDPAVKDRENAINAFTRAYAIEQGFPFVDMRSVTVDPETDGWKAGYNGKLQDGSPDPSHPAPLGAFHMGKALAEALAPFMMPVYPQMAISNPVTSGGPNAIINPLFLDTVNGLPSGWVVESGTVSLTTDPDVVGNVLVVTGAGNTSARVSQTIPVTPGERRKFSFRVKFDVDENAATACFLEANGANIAGIRPSNQSTEGFRTFSYDVVIPAGMTEMKLTIVANGATTSVGQMGLLKLEEV